MDGWGAYALFVSQLSTQPSLRERASNLLLGLIRPLTIQVDQVALLRWAIHLAMNNMAWALLERTSLLNMWNTSFIQIIHKQCP